MKLQTIKRDIARGGYVAALTMAASVYGSHPVPLPLLRFSRALATYDNPLTPRSGVPILDPAKIEDRDLAWLFEGRGFTEWSLNHDAINFLRRLYLDLQPEAVLEFGSGVSTAVFSYLMRDQIAEGDARLVSVEQSADFAAETMTMLQRAGLEDAPRFVVSGMREDTFDGERVSCYGMSDDFLTGVVADVQPSLIFIDGPFGAGPVRGPILPRLLPYLTVPTTVILDDALRDNEMRILDAWSNLPGVTVKGIHLIRKGMAEISVTPHR